MKINRFKLAITTFLLSASLFSVHAADWYVCLSSFKSEEKAQELKEYFSKNDIGTILYEYKAKDGTTYYRVLFDRKYEEKDSAAQKKSELSRNRSILNKKINDLWICQIDFPKEEPKAPAPQADKGTAVRFFQQDVEPEPQEPVIVQDEVFIPEEEDETEEEIYFPELEQEPEYAQQQEPEPEPETEPEPAPEESVLEIEEPEEEPAVNLKKILIVDADNSEPVPGAVLVLNEEITLTAGDDGFIFIPAEISFGEYDGVVTCGEAYVETKEKVVLSEYDEISTHQIAIPKKVNYRRIKIILEWARFPADLDSHVFSDAAHINFENRSEANLNLDNDERAGYGPETVTITAPEETEKYEYYVFNYSNAGEKDNYNLSYSKARVRVYIDNTYITHFNIVPGATGTVWHVFDVINGNEIVPVNAMEEGW